MAHFGVEVSKGFVAKILLAIAGFLGSVVFARVLGPEVYGAYAILLSLLHVLDNPITGFGQAYKKRISETDTDRGEIVGMGVLVGGAIVAVIAASLYLVADIPYIEVEHATTFLIILLGGVGGFLIFQPMIAGVGDFGTAIVIDMIRSFLTIPIQLALVLLGFELGGMVYGLAIASVLTVPVSLKVLGVYPTMPSWATVRSVWAFAKYSIPKGIVGTTYSNLDILIIGAVLTTGLSGQYKVAMNIVLPATFISAVMASGLFAEVSKLRSQDEDVTTVINLNVSFASFFAIPMFFGVLAMPESIVVTVYGPEYAQAGLILLGLAFYQIFNTQSSQLQSVISGLDRPDLGLYILSITLVLNIILGVYLALEIGVMGVVVATIIAEMATLGMLMYSVRRRVSYGFVPKTLRREIYSGILMFGVVYGFHELHPVSSWIDLLLIVGTGVVVYVGVMFLISSVFQETVKGIVRDIEQEYRPKSI